MARSLSLMVVVALALATVASAARDMPAGDKGGLADQKNVIGFTGVGTYYGIGDNGIPFGGVGGGVGTNGLPGVPGGLGAGGVIGTNPQGVLGGVGGIIPGGVVGWGGNTGGAGLGSGSFPSYP